MLFSEAQHITPVLSMVPLVVFLPVIGLVINLLFGKRFGEGSPASLPAWHPAELSWLRCC